MTSSFISALLILVSLTFPQEEPNFHSIVVANELPHRRNVWLVSYDKDFAWMARDFGDSRDFGGGTKPGVFVHSKASDRWLRISLVSTEGAKFGKSVNPRLAAPWDFTRLAEEKFVPLPIPTGGAIHLPDRVVYNEDRDAYLMYFNSESQVTMTMLVISRKDLLAAFEHYRDKNYSAEGL
jgi:hypothetical protein